MKMLEFEMPYFQRLSWANDRAASTWGQRLLDVRKSWNDISIASVAQGMRSVGSLLILRDQVDSLESRLVSSRLHVKRLNAYPHMTPQQGIVQLLFAKTSQELEAFLDAFTKRDSVKMGTLYGYPSCCISEFHRLEIEEAFIDPAWWLFKEASSQQATSDTGPKEKLVYHDFDPECNFLYHRMGIQSCFHLPCSLNCKPSVDLSTQLFKIGKRMGYEVEMSWLSEIMRWPVAWSTLHGISELKTPVFKSIYNAPVTAYIQQVHLHGDHMPMFSEPGIRFPYRKPAKMKVTGSKGYKRGMESPLVSDPKIIR